MPASKRRAADAAYDAIEVHFSTLQLAPGSPVVAVRDYLEYYMCADHALDLVNHQASENRSAVNCVVPLVVLCRRFWYAYQHEGEMREGARAHMQLAEGIAMSDELAAVRGANGLMHYLDVFARRVIER